MMAEEKREAKKEERPKGKELGHRVRILTTDIDSTRSLLVGLARIKGVGHNLAKAVISKLAMDPKKKLGDLSEQEIENIERAMNDPSSLGLPPWMLNRRRDMDTGKDIHLNTSDLTFAGKSDLDLLGEIKSYRGLRHARKLKVRGQRTKSTGRGQSAVGVQRKKK